MIYDPEANLISITLAKGKISHAKEIGNIVIHVSAKGTPLLIEILEAGSLTGQFEKLKDIRDLRKIVPNV